MFCIHSWDCLSPHYHKEETAGSRGVIDQMTTSEGKLDIISVVCSCL